MRSETEWADEEIDRLAKKVARLERELDEAEEAKLRAISAHDYCVPSDAFDEQQAALKQATEDRKRLLIVAAAARDLLNHRPGARERLEEAVNTADTRGCDGPLDLAVLRAMGL